MVLNYILVGCPCTLFGTRQKCDIHRRFFKFTEWKKSTLIILWHYHYSLTHALFGTRQKCDIHRRLSEKSQLWSFFISYSIRHAAEDIYIVHFLGFRSEILNFGYSLSRTLFGTRQKCDIHRRFFKFTEWKKSTLIIL